MDEKLSEEDSQFFNLHIDEIQSKAKEFSKRIQSHGKDEVILVGGKKIRMVCEESLSAGIFHFRGGVNVGGHALDYWIMVGPEKSANG